MENIVSLSSNFLCGMLLPAVLFICGAMFFVHIGRYVFSPRFCKRVLASERKGSLSSFWLALGGTLGVGNICGVASAIYVGGAGCIFWIWVCAIFSSVVKYAETVLAVKYRENLHGGTPYYIKNGLGLKFIPQLFCVLCIFTAFTMGNITQVKAAAGFAETALNIPTVIPAIIFAVSVFFLVSGKGKRISKFTSKAVPFLCVVYSVFCIISIVKFRQNIPNVTRAIINGAFTPRAGMGGFIGILCCPALRLGITRGVMSNEAGCGTAPIAYAHDPDALPAKSGLFGIFEVLVDTLILCSLTAYAVLLPAADLSADSSKIITDAFSLAIGNAVKPVLAFSVFLFALAAVSAWAFYAEESAHFLGLTPMFGKLFAALYAITAFLGCFMKENIVWALADISVSAMAVLNIIAVIVLFGNVKNITKKEFQNQINISKKEP